MQLKTLQILPKIEWKPLTLHLKPVRVRPWSTSLASLPPLSFLPMSPSTNVKEQALPPCKQLCCSMPMDLSCTFYLFTPAKSCSCSHPQPACLSPPFSPSCPQCPSDVSALLPQGFKILQMRTWDFLLPFSRPCIGLGTQKPCGRHLPDSTKMSRKMSPFSVTVLFASVAV